MNSVGIFTFHIIVFVCGCIIQVNLNTWWSLQCIPVLKQVVHTIRMSSVDSTMGVQFSQLSNVESIHYLNIVTIFIHSTKNSSRKRYCYSAMIQVDFDRWGWWNLVACTLPYFEIVFVRWVLQGSVDTLVRRGGQLSCHAMSNYERNFVCQKLLKSDNYSSTYSQ